MDTTEKFGEMPRVDFRRTAFLLDVDGTLLDIAPDPGAVNVPRQLPGCLAGLEGRCSGALAFVSGRTLAQLDALFAPAVLPAIGSHGGEIRFGRNDVFREPPLPENVKAWFRGLADADPRILYEDKGCSLAFHYRRVPQILPVLLQALQQKQGELHENGLEVLRGKAIIEIKPSRYSKATALRRLMQVQPFAGRQPLFAGDDTTDEDVFAVLPEMHGTGISVGRRMTGAAYSIGRPEDMRSWLCWLEAETG